jgi:hypothetical protein
MAAQMQNNAWSPHMYSPMPQNHNQQTMPAFNTHTSMLPMSGMQDTSPVGSSPNDDVLLAEALLRSSDKGQTYKQALESLHGVRHLLFLESLSNLVNATSGQ